MGSSAGSQFLSEKPAGIRYRLASASVALAGAGAGFLVAVWELVGRVVAGRCGTVADDRRAWEVGVARGRGWGS